YRENRGMSFMTDIRDSLGGYPYEFASAGEIFNFCKKEFGFTLENLKTVNTLSLNEFLFRKPAE
ncbi:MAG: class I SAM-dependent methyltransferase, partial [Nitrospirota bacterium]|nr:class I SAM-dependent methyltransferase [Nitrospirota bacterium]